MVIATVVPVNVDLKRLRAVIPRKCEALERKLKEEEEEEEESGERRQRRNKRKSHLLYTAGQTQPLNTKHCVTPEHRDKTIHLIPSLLPCSLP